MLWNIKKIIDTISESVRKYPNLTFSKRRQIYTCINPYSYSLIRKHRDLYSKMNGLYVDGIFMCILIRLLWSIKVPRLSFDMSGMAVDLFQRLNSSQETIYLLGAKQELLEKSIIQIQKAYPEMNIIGYRNGYFASIEERKSVIDEIIETNPDFVIVGMGSPIQEKFVLDLQNSGYQGIAFTCGGFLHQTSNQINYYPEWINKYNLRAFYRLFKEKGLWKRLWRVLIQFPTLFIIDTIQYKLSYKE